MQPAASHPSSMAGEGFVDRAIRLFEFLAQAQLVRSAPIRHVDAYSKRDGSVIWFHAVPSHPAVQSALAGAPVAGEPLLVIDRLPRMDPPKLPDRIVPWLDAPTDEPDQRPQLRESVTVSSQERDSEPPVPVTIERLTEHPEVRAGFERWIDDWEVWAADERAASPIRMLYSELFRAHLTSANASEEWEWRLGVGALSWHPSGHDPVLRHLLTVPASVDFDDGTGRITVRTAEDGRFAVELDMLDHEWWVDPVRLNEVKGAARDYDGHPLDRDGVGNLVRRLTHNLDSDGRYLEDLAPSAPRSVATSALAPALILRRRSHQGLVDIFQTIAGQLRERGEVPAGLRVLLDPDQAPIPGEPEDPSLGAWVQDGNDTYLPLPVNDKQREVIRRVDRRPLTLVQGPPGTGKTHTAATLIAHLLAQGKRVLVTAQTDRALKELRGKLPLEIRDLSVSIVGSGQQELAELRVAVDKLAHAAAEYDAHESQRMIEEAWGAIEDRRRHKAKLARDLLEAREAERIIHEHGGFTGTLAVIAAKRAEVSKNYEWLASFVGDSAGEEPPIKNVEALELLRLLQDREIAADSEEAVQDLPELDQLPDPDTYAQLVEHERSAAAAAASHAQLRLDRAYLRSLRPPRGRSAGTPRPCS